MMLYIIAEDSLWKLRNIMMRMPNRTKDEHADVKELAGIIEAVEENTYDGDNPYDDPSDD